MDERRRVILKSTEIRDEKLLFIFTTIRLVVSTAFRIVYPYLPAFGRGLGVPIEAVAAAVSARSALGFFGPLFGTFADMRGRKQALVIGLVAFGLSLGLIGFLPNYTIFFAGMVISGGATVVIDSSIHSYLGDKIPYARRGQAVAIVELGWSLAFVIGIPLMGWVMSRLGWNAPFIWLGIAGLMAGGLVSLFIPRLSPTSESWNELKAGLRGIISPAPLFGLVLALFTVMANQVVSIVFGVWMEDAFGMQLAQLGAASSVIGFAGIIGVTCAILLTDRIGKRFAIGIGLAVNSFACLAFPLFEKNLWGALIALFLFFMTFEFTLTSLLPLMTSLSTQARGVFMAATLAAVSLGDSLGALFGPVLITKGMIVTSGAAIALNLAALIILITFVHPMEKAAPVNLNGSI